MITELTPTLRRAARYRAMSLCFAPPDAASINELCALARDLGDDGDGGALAALAAEAHDDLEALYHSALGPTGVVRDCEADYEVNPLGGRGPLLADVAGFYLAFHYEDTTLTAMSPDHISVELGFMAWLSLRLAYAGHVSDPDGAAICAEASDKFAKEHLGRWCATLFARIRERSPGTWYDRAAAWAQSAIERMEPGRVAPPVIERRKVSLPTLDESDECGLPPGASAEA